MTDIDKLFAEWVKSNIDQIMQQQCTISEMMTGSDVNADLNEIVSDIGLWPSDYDTEPGNFEDLSRALDDMSYDVGLAVPDQIIAYKLGIWLGKEVSPNHELVKNHKKYKKIVDDIVWDESNHNEELRLSRLLKSAASDEVAEHIMSDEKVAEHYDAEMYKYKATDIVMVRLDDYDVIVVPTESNVVLIKYPFSSDKYDDIESRVLDYNGNLVRTNKTRMLMSIITDIHYHMSKTGNEQVRLIEKGELASIVGNNVVDVIGGDSIGIFDLPDA
jgi:hypothetical protein